MQIHSAEFIKSSVSPDACPKPVMPEYAFIGRSNVGKSSLINMLAGRKKLAHISSTPGKTQTINHFKINDKWYLVDLPGYGYAKRSKKERAKWDRFIKSYIEERPNLMGMVVLIDINIPPQKSDLEFMEWLGINQIPFMIVFTKADKLSSSKLNKNMLEYKQEMLKQWEEMPEFFISSSKTRLGKQELLSFIENTNKAFIKK